MLAATTAMAQLPRECFFVADVHGPSIVGADLISDLPILMGMYQPGMHLEAVTAMTKPEHSHLIGLQL